MLLGIDTSGAVSVALARGDLDGAAEAASAAPQVLASRTDTRARHHDEVLLELIDAVLTDGGVDRSELTGVVVGRGPGPFTGLRVGLVSARSIAAVLGVPLYGLCSLDAIAHQAFAERSGSGTDGDVHTVGVALDARRREVYHARYRREGDGPIVREHEPAVSAPAAVADALRACDQLVGSGTGLYPEVLPATSDLAHADAGHLIVMAAELLAQGHDLSSTEPLYLREPDAAKPTARKSALGR